jgi:hypothetical protein
VNQGSRWLRSQLTESAYSQIEIGWCGLIDVGFAPIANEFRIASK